MNTREILKNLIEKLYSESLTNGLNFNMSPYDSGGTNYLIADDGTFLGNFSNQYDPNSIFNSYGPYGSRYSSTCIFNRYSPYGGRYSIQSPINPYTTTPPKIFINNQYFGRLTTNKYISEAKAPDIFLFYILNKLNLLDQKLNDLVEFISEI